MAYIGTSPSNGVRRRFVYEATASQTSFSGSDENGVTLTYVDSLYLDVFQNGIKLKAGDDYTATTGTSVVLVQGASVNDVVEMVAFDVFSVNDSVSAKDGGNFAGNVGMGGTLAVTGNTTVGGTLGVTGNTTVGGTLGVTGVHTVGSNAVITSEGGAVNKTLVAGTVKQHLHLKGTDTFAILGSLNTASATDNGTGDYATGFTSNYANDDYALGCSTIKGGGAASGTNYAIGISTENQSTSACGLAIVGNGGGSGPGILDRDKCSIITIGSLA